ncbi:PIG-L family deacetylase [Candidatus Woesearchaeota archaeon]|jgi:N-acetylglucosamine malate deacetylase 1|nr:PIG-L family deacetylase [Candidatus Woesearchaeota archaeon]MBT5396893.1 PIG-L family deacetylase [Candidatus Woesearchaeota archaeon]MBT5924488.1 PIG-L family deacetylase [Candidatus Woesearchaeota archaeon]MBT6367086.1 PIG-L family deacetylase [Candidatus Woesearchaeota archaeon]MBT7762340.1 PIG-L family deacetylase [Candidatus Woesearchaeota archaeon]
MGKESIVVFGAHSDDFVIGSGATIAKYSKEGTPVTSIVFSYGEKSHPWLKEAVIKKMRAHEAIEASTILGCKTYIHNLREMNFIEDYKTNNIEEKIIKLLTKVKPTKIFTHSPEDPHPDHKAVYTITMALIQKLSWKPEVYIYSIWNPVSFKTDYPVLYVNVSKTFSLKLRALKTFRSQRFHAIYPLLILVFKRAFVSGIKIRKKFAERFYRIQ